MSEDMEFDDQLIEEYLRYLRGRGPRPSTRDLSEDEQVKHEDLFRLLDAIVDADMVEAPPFEEDPVAVRLGLTVGTDPRPGVREGSERDGPAQVSDAIASSLREVVHQLNNEIEVVPSHGNGQLRTKANGLRAIAECRSLGDVVLVCVTHGNEFSALPSAVAALFASLPTLTAVAVVSSSTRQSVVLTPADCVLAMDPALGWVGPALPAPPEPLELALRRHFERSLPRWDEIARLDELLLLAHADEDISAAVVDAVRSNLERAAKIPAKKRALADLKNLAVAPIETVIHGIRSERLTGEQLIEILRNISEEVS